MNEIKAIVTGMVQGVFFRATVKDHASSFSLTGYAKNLDDGSVEIVAQGSKEDLEKFLQKVKENPGKAQIKKVSFSYRESTQSFENFKIL